MVRVKVIGSIQANIFFQMQNLKFISKNLLTIHSFIVVKKTRVLKTTLFMIFVNVTSSDWPPDKKTIPGTAGGLVRLNAVTVARPTSSAVVLNVLKKVGNFIK